MPKLCKGGEKLRAQIDARWPNRDRRSDGWIGDKAHADRVSQHNPDSEGIVYAIDIDEYMGKGPDRNGKTAQRLANELVAYALSGLPGANRVKYVVYENKLASGTYPRYFWQWRKGSWGHTQHIHISFTTAAKRDSTVWPLPILTKNPVKKRAWAKALKTK